MQKVHADFNISGLTVLKKQWKKKSIIANEFWTCPELLIFLIVPVDN